MQPTIHVPLGSRSYPIYIGEGLLNEQEFIAKLLGPRQIVLITNEIVAPLYLKQVAGAFAQDSCHTLILPDGEATKSFERFADIQGFLLERRVERSAVLVALGGGVIGDLVGFAAACYQRGVDYVQIPTTLLAQVDSSVGGKTAVNHPLGKNMIGAFHQPRAVIVDTGTLATLPDREFRSGLAEVIKYGLIQDRPLLEWLEANMPALLAREHGALAHAICRSCQNKVEVVVDDEREAGRRALLNLGHTFGHAIETALGYGAWLHGEAVAAGMCMAARLSAQLGWLTCAELERIEVLVRSAVLPTEPPSSITPRRFRELMSHDKKNQGGRIRLVLLKALGQACVTSDYDDAKLSEILALSSVANDD